MSLFSSTYWVISSTEYGSTEKLPKPPYSVLKEKKIREMLAEHDLATTGSKDQLVARHSQYVPDLFLLRYTYWDL